MSDSAHIVELITAQNEASLPTKPFDLSSVIAQSFLELETISSKLQSNLMTQFDEILRLSSPPPSRKSKPFLQSTGFPTSLPISSDLDDSFATSSEPSCSQSGRFSDPSPLPEFIEHAYKFFTANIHNPYPTREQKQIIVDSSNNARVTLTSVSNWFTNARRRCGWAEILKNRCAGNRDQMVVLAKQIFVDRIPNPPIDAQVVAEFMQMKESIETMYEKKTRTSAWIQDLGSLDYLVSQKRSEEDLKQRRKTQTHLSLEVDKGTRRRPRDQRQDASNMEYAASSSRSSIFSSSYDADEDEEIVSGSMFTTIGKRKNFHEDHGFLGIRNISPASSLSSFSFTSDSPDGRVPSLSWSDSGDEARPHKRSRSNLSTPTLSSPMSPELLFPLDESFNLNTLPVTPIRGQKRPCTDVDATPKAKRIRSDTMHVAQDTNTSPTFTPMYHVSGPVPNLSSFMPIDLETLFSLSAHESPQPVEMTPPDASVPLEVGVFDWSNILDSFDITGRTGMELGNFGIEGVHSRGFAKDFPPMFQFTSSSAVESQTDALDSIVSQDENEIDLDAGIENSQSEEFPLLAAPPQFAPEQSPPPVPLSELPLPDLQVDLTSFELTSLWPQSNPQISLTEPSDLTSEGGPGQKALDLSGLMSGLLSTQTLGDFGFDDYLMQTPAQVEMSIPTSDSTLNVPFSMLRSPSVTSTWASTSVSPTPEAESLLVATSSAPNDSKKKDVTIDLTGQDLELVERALKKEFKRRELVEKKAALERERARLEELEKELEDD